MAQVFFLFKLRSRLARSLKDGVGDESDESDESHEGNEGHESHEGHEEEDGEQDRKGQASEGQRVLRWQGEDVHGTEEGGSHEEQDRQGGYQEVTCGRQEGVQEHQRLDRGCPEGQEGARCERLRRDQEGLRTVQKAKEFYN